MKSFKTKARAAGVVLLVAFFLIGMNVPACGTTAVHTEVAVQAPRQAVVADRGAEGLKKNLQRTLRRIVALQIRELISAVMS